MFSTSRNLFTEAMSHQAAMAMTATFFAVASTSLIGFALWGAQNELRASLPAEE